MKTNALFSLSLVVLLALTPTMPVATMVAHAQSAQPENHAATPVTTSATAPLFKDVTENQPHFEALKALKESGILNGYPDGSFKPDAPITRAEVVALLLKINAITAEKSTVKVPFTDVSADSWFYPMIQKAVSLKKVKGFDDGTFKPLSNVTLPEALTLSFSFFNLDTTKAQIEGTIYDGIDSKAWYAKPLQYAKNMFILTPSLVATAKPASYDLSKALTRSEFAEVMFRTQKVKKNSSAIDITQGWITTENPNNYFKLRHPTEWAVFKGTANSVIWNKKPNTPFFTRLWPTGVRLSLSVVENENKLSAAVYYDLIKRDYTDEYGAAKVLFFNQTIGNQQALKVVVPDSRLIDVYLRLPNEKFLVFYGEYGSAPIGEYLKKQLELVIASYQYMEPPPVPPKVVLPLEDRLQTLREKILIASGWTTVKDLFEDKKLISTDGIGVGTGPVDYYFSAEANYTIKVERNSATILNIRETQTTSF